MALATSNAAQRRQQISTEDLKSHNLPNDCWIAIENKVWDVTEFLSLHPGGAEAILKYAGNDATRAYSEVHAPGILEGSIEDEKFIGYLLPSSDVASTLDAKDVPKIHDHADRALQTTENLSTPDSLRTKKPNLHSLISANDFEHVAKQTLTPKAWAFYSSAATDLITHSLNKKLVRRIMFRPRILRDVRTVRMNRKILGCPSSVPFFIAPAAMARLAHPDGECALAKASGREEIIQCISSNASYPLASIIEAGVPDQPFFLQVYVNSDRSKTKELLQNAAQLNIKGIFVTVDAPVPGKREADERIAAESVASAISGAVASNDKKGGGMGRLMAQYVDKSLVWDDLKWIADVSGLPVVLKGVQSAADAMLALEHGVAGIMLSNHGGRSLDGAQPAILVLLELRRICPSLFEKIEVYVDGGFERGSDILKAVALGVTAVGVGRPYLYSLCYGEDGVEHITQILKDELETSMRLCGITDIDQAHSGLVNSQDIDHLIPGTTDHSRVCNTSKAKL